MRWSLFLISAGFLGLTACTHSTTMIVGITPTYPIEWKFLESIPTVDRDRPTFSWQPAANPNLRYDFIIYEAHAIGPSSNEWAIGKELYYREGLEQAEHQLEDPLMPGRTYFWSVRTRRGDAVSEWSRFSLRRCDMGKVAGPPECHTEEFPFFIFKRPPK